MAFEAVGEILAGVLRIVFRIFAEIVIEFLVKGAGYIICRPFSKNVDIEDIKVVVVGIFFWIGVVLFAIHTLNNMQADKCIDQGGTYNDEANICVQEE